MLVVRHLEFEALPRVQNALLQTQCIGMVFVVVVNHRETSIAVTLIKTDSHGIIRPHLEAQVGTIVIAGTRLRPVQ
ncbi:hypothetical protein D9M71_713800 [compost metagenome]